MKLFLEYLRQRGKVILRAAVFCVIFLASFALYHLPAGAVVYPAALCLVLGTVFAIFDFQKIRRKHRQLTELQKHLTDLVESLPEAAGIEEADYQQLIALLCGQRRRLETQMETRYKDMVDYYTVWAHQIKTPIASMRLHLQNEDTSLSRQLMSDLNRIEQYVEMALVFLRLDSETTDYVIGSYDLDAIVKAAVKKFSGEFIGRRLKLEYAPLHAAVLTDEKWLSFVVEQALSNALKYTREGTISIYLEAPKTLCIRDTGIGIARSDLPRVFEKGYTGYNGRSDKKASGLGLYLCKRICGNLRHQITAQSRLDEGTVIRIDLSSAELQVE